MERKSVFITETSHITGEVYGVFVDDEGLLRNVKIVDKELAVKLQNTPAVVPNPERAHVEEEAFAAAEKKIADEKAAAEASAAEAAARAAEAEEDDDE